MNLEALKEPFAEKDIEWRVQASGSNNNKVWARVLAYITNRAIMDRLDAVCGIENWRNEYASAPDGGVMCGISVRINNEWVTKWDGAENTDIEGVKGGLSNAMKRAGVQWGMGRYLYNLDAYYAEVSDSGVNRAQTKDKVNFRWNPPTLPAWALPARTKGATTVNVEKAIEREESAQADNAAREKHEALVKKAGELAKQAGLSDAQKLAMFKDCGNSIEAVIKKIEAVINVNVDKEATEGGLF